MIVGIDGNEANIANRVGINKYAYEIIKNIYNLLPKNKDLIIYVYLKDKPLPDMPHETEQFKYKILKPRKMWVLSRLTPYLLKNPEKLGVFFSPSHYTPPFLFIPKICAIMDLGYLEFSAQFKKYDYWQLKLWSAWSMNTSKYILTISSATRKDIVRQYPNSANKIVITYPGYDEYLTTKKFSSSITSKLLKKYSIVHDYVLYLGTLKPSKNIEGLIEAFAKVKAKKSNMQLIIAGKKGWLYDSIFNKVKELGVEDSVIFTDFVTDQEKLVLIKNATVFALPSFWEGFGLDVLTAFALETPVLASNVGSLPEVVGDAGILVNPKDINSIALGLSKIISMNASERDKLKTKEKMQLHKFSWTDTAQKTIEIFRKAVNV